MIIHKTENKCLLVGQIELILEFKFAREVYFAEWENETSIYCVRSVSCHVT